jgi:hypothetical protein
MIGDFQTDKVRRVLLPDSEPVDAFIVIPLEKR